MSTALEDRLVAALEARAELVAPEDLSHLTLPGPGRPRWRRPAVIAVAAVAAAAVAAVVVPTVLQGGRSDHEPPTTPPPPVYPVQTPGVMPMPKISEQLSGDVDSDGRDDRIRVVGQELRVTLAADPSHPLSVSHPHLVGLAGLADVGRPGAGILTVNDGTSPKGSVSWGIWVLQGGHLRELTQTDNNPPGSQAGSVLGAIPEQLTSWITAAGVPMSGLLDPAQEGQRYRSVRVTSFEPDAHGLVMSAPVDWCWDVKAQRVPAPCPANVTDAYDPGPHGDLPALLPRSSPDWLQALDGPADAWTADGTQLRLEKATPITSSFADQVYDVTGTIDGASVSAPVGKTGTQLFETYVDLGRGVRGLAAADPTANAWTLLALTDEGLVPLRNPGPGAGGSSLLSLHPGTGQVLVDGRQRAAETWIADGLVLTSVATADPARFRVYQWQMDPSARAAEPVDLGLVCLDQFQGSYGTCTS